MVVMVMVKLLWMSSVGEATRKVPIKPGKCSSDNGHVNVSY